MGAIERASTGAQVPLRAWHIVGRSVTEVHLHLSHTDVSRHHAYLFWDQQCWWVRDVSRNGVWIDEVRIAYADAVRLSPGSTIRFGIEAENVFKLVDASEPQSTLEPVAGDGQYVVLDGPTTIPAESGIAEIRRNQLNQFVLSWDNTTRVVADGDLVQIGDQSYRLHDVAVGTPAETGQRILPTSLESVVFRFRVSQDQEHVHLVAEPGTGRIIDLGERTHHYLLLTLARQRYQDFIKGFDMASQGWLDMTSICTMLGMDPSHVNIQVFRARKQISAALEHVIGADQVIERRSGGLRLGVRRFEVTVGSVVEAALTDEI